MSVWIDVVPSNDDFPMQYTLVSDTVKHCSSLFQREIIKYRRIVSIFSIS